MGVDHVATKFGEGFYEIYPQINKQAQNAARDAIGKKLSEEFARAQADMRDQQQKTTDQGLSDDKKTRTSKKQTSDESLKQFYEYTRVAQQGRRAADKEEKGFAFSRAKEQLALGKREETLGKQRVANVKKTQSAESFLSKARTEFSKKFNRETEGNETVLHHLATQFRTVGTVAKGIGLSTSVASSFGILEGAIGAAAAAAPILGAALVAIPAAIASVVTEAVVLKIAFNGVGSAIKDGFDPSKVKDFNKELAKLSPSARKFVKDIVNLKNVKLPNLQEAFFSQKSLQDAGKRLKGFVQSIAPELKGVAEANGKLFGNILGGLETKQGTKTFQDLFKGITAGIKNAAPGIAVFEKGILHLIDGVGKLGGAGGKNVNKFLTGFGNALNKIDVAKLFKKASGALHSFKLLADQIAGSLSGIFKALGGSDKLGSVFFKNITGFFAEINKFVNSKIGQKFLSQLIGTLNALSSLSAVIVKDALGFLAGAFASLYPKIKPVVDEIHKILDDLVPLGPIVGGIAAGAFTAFKVVLKFIEPVIEAIVSTISKHKGLFITLGSTILVAAAAFKVLNAVMHANPLGLIITLIAAVVVGLIYAYDHFKTFRTIVNDTWKVIQTGAVYLWHYVLEPFFKFVAFYLKNIVIPFFTTLWKVVKHAFQDVIAPVVLFVWNHILAPLFSFIGKAVPKVIGFFNRLSKNVAKVWNAIGGYVSAAWQVITTTFGDVKDFCSSVVSSFQKYLVKPIQKVWDAVSSGVDSLWQGIVGFFVSGVNFGIDVVNGLTSALISGVDFVIGIVNDVIGGIDAVSKYVGFHIDTIPPISATALQIGYVHNPYAGAAAKKLNSKGRTSDSDTRGHASGGPIKGPGGPTADKIHAMLSDGEFVVNAKMAKRYQALLQLINGGQLTGFAAGGPVGVPRYASGGSVGSATAVLTSGGAGYGKTVAIFNALTKETTKLIASFTTMDKETGKSLSAVTDNTAKMQKGVGTNLDGTQAHTDKFWKSVQKSFTTGFKTIGTTTSTLPASFTKPVEAQYTTVQNRTGTMWTHIVGSFNNGIKKGVKQSVAQLPAAFVTPARKSYNSAIRATASTWTNINKQFTQGVRNTGTASSQLVKANQPGVQGLVSVYENNIKKVWDSVAVPLKLPKLNTVSYQKQSVTAAKVTPVAAQAPIYVATGSYISGKVRGPGGPREDKVPAMLSDGEFVVNARQTKAHRALLERINSGSIRGYASGGAVESVPQVLDWLKSIAGRVPYVLGGNGPNSFDCSSLVGNVWARLTGHQRNVRYFVTGNERPWLLSHGFAPGADPSGFTVGLTSPPEHTVGILAGHRFEAAHTGTRMRFDDGATNALSMSQRFHFGGIGGFGAITDKQVKSIKDAAAKKIPGDSKQAQMLRAIPDQLAPKMQAKTVAAQKALFAQFADFTLGSGGDLGQGGGGVLGWIKSAQNFVGFPNSWIPGIETIIRRESGGNPNAINRTDSNARAGHPSQGLMQTIPSTFNAFVPKALRGLGILNPVANIAAAVRYIESRYGSIFNVQQANPRLPRRGYSFGGPVLKRDRGGPVPTGFSTIFNGTGAPEWINDPQQMQGFGQQEVDVRVSFDSDEAEKFVDVRVSKNNERLSRALGSNGRRGRR